MMKIIKNKLRKCCRSTQAGKPVVPAGGVS